MAPSNSIVTPVILAAGLAAAWFMAPPLFPTQPTEPQLAAIHPIAALAWVQAHCNSDMALDPGAPRIQAEDLFVMSAALDERAAAAGFDRVCRAASAHASSVSVPGAPTSVEDATGTKLARHDPG